MNPVGIFGYAFLAMAITFIIILVLISMKIVMPSGQRKARLARKNGWIAKGICLKRTYRDDKDDANTRERPSASESYWIGEYEYKVNGKTYVAKLTTFEMPPASAEILYDARHGNKAINSSKQGFLFKIISIIPIVVFIATLYILSHI